MYHSGGAYWSWESLCMLGSKSVREISGPSPQFCCAPKAALKKLILKKKKIFSFHCPCTLQLDKSGKTRGLNLEDRKQLLCAAVIFAVWYNFSMYIYQINIYWVALLCDSLSEKKDRHDLCSQSGYCLAAKKDNFISRIKVW